MRYVKPARPLLVLLVATGTITVAHAHHAAANYDLNTEVTLNGVVTVFKLVNPHAYVYFDVLADGGEPQHWRCEMIAATSMKRLGWTPESLKPGEHVKITGALARHEDDVCYLKSVEFADGTTVARNGRFERGGSAENTAVAANAAEAVVQPTRLANGLPNLSGTWVAARGPGRRRGPGPGAGGPGGRFGPPAAGSGPGGRLGPPPPGGGRGPRPGGPPGAPKPTAAGAQAAEGYDQPYDDPAIKCDPANIIFAWGHDQHVNEIRQQDDKITLQYGYMDLFRTIHLDQSEHPASITPTEAGDSIGRWDGDTLVVDTAGFKQGVLIPIVGLMHSADMQITERFSLSADGRELIRAYTVHDPAFLQSDMTGRDVMLRTSEPYEPYACTELSGANNRR